MSEDSRRKGLGRGLSALLDEAPEDQATVERLRAARTLPIEQIQPSPFQPRRHFDEAEMQSLVQSVRENGVLMPILVRPAADEPGHYQIIAGERRWRAAQAAQVHEVPVVIRELSDGQALELALIENIQRQDLTPIEEAEGYKRLIDEFGHTQEAIAGIVGKSRSHVANALRLLNLPDAVRSMVHQGGLSAGHARALLAAPDVEMAAKTVLSAGLNVRETERMMQSGSAPGGQGEAARRGKGAKDPNTGALERQLSEKLGLKVSIDHRGAGGQVKIEYKSLDQFDVILKKLTSTE